MTNLIFECVINCIYRMTMERNSLSIVSSLILSSKLNFYCYFILFLVVILCNSFNKITFMLSEKNCGVLVLYFYCIYFFTYFFTLYRTKVVNSVILKVNEKKTYYKPKNKIVTSAYPFRKKAKNRLSRVT